MKHAGLAVMVATGLLLGQLVMGQGAVAEAGDEWCSGCASAMRADSTQPDASPKKSK